MSGFTLQKYVKREKMANVWGQRKCIFEKEL